MVIETLAMYYCSVEYTFLDKFRRYITLRRKQSTFVECQQIQYKQIEDFERLFWWKVL